MNKFLLAILLTLLPLVELRGGLPLALISASEAGVPLTLAFFGIVFLNILVVFFVFFFLDNFHEKFMNYKFYKNFYNFSLRKMQKRITKFEKAHSDVGILALFLFVAIPLPGTGVYSGAFLSWLLNLERKKSLFAISFGVFIAGLIIFLGTLGIFSFKI